MAMEGRRWQWRAQKRQLPAAALHTSIHMTSNIAYAATATPPPAPYSACMSLGIHPPAPNPCHQPALRACGCHNFLGPGADRGIATAAHRSYTGVAAARLRRYNNSTCATAYSKGEPACVGDTHGFVRVLLARDEAPFGRGPLKSRALRIQLLAVEVIPARRAGRPMLQMLQAPLPGATRARENGPSDGARLRLLA